MYTYLCVCVFVFNHIRGRWSPITSSSTGGQNFQCLPWDGDPRGQNCLRHDFLMKIMYNIYIYMCVCVLCMLQISWIFGIHLLHPPKFSSFLCLFCPGRIRWSPWESRRIYACGPPGATRCCRSEWSLETLNVDVVCIRTTHSHTGRESRIYIYYIQLLIITSIYSIHMYIHTICHMFLFIYL